jgi:tetratricopeptide (TPR) repeat protein
LGERPDLRIARRPDTAWGRAEFRRRHPAPGGPPLLLLSEDPFFLSAASEVGPERVFLDDARRMPEIDPATGLAVSPKIPDDVAPNGAAFQFLPSDSHKLISPSAQLSLDRVALWAAREGDPEGLASAYTALGRKFDQYALTADAEEEYLSAISIDPGQPEARRRLGEIALERGEAADACVHFRRALRRAPKDAAIHALLGRAARQAQDLPAAVRAYEIAVRLDPSLEEDRRALAELLEERAAWRAAAREWRVLMDKNPQERAYPWRLAKAEAAAGRPTQARNALREYMLFPLDEKERDQAESFQKSLPQ